MKLHLGCGKRDFGEKWVHIDAGDFPHVTSHSITKLPFDDSSCSLIYASHVIEYFDRKEIIPVLKEWHRVIRPEGVIRLAVPDFRMMAELYTNSLTCVGIRSCDIELFLGPLYGKMTPVGCQNSIYHKTVYDFTSLREILLSIGFCNIRKYDWKETEHAHIDDHSQAYLPHMDKQSGALISLNVEGTKSE